MLITIGSTIISFPASAGNPNWAGSIIQFAKAVESALSTIVSPFDVGQRVMNIDNKITDSSVDVSDGATPLTFPVDPTITESGIRSAFVRYGVYRKRDTGTSVTETGDLLIMCNPETTPVFTLSRSRLGDANVVFSITSTGQVQVSFSDPGGTGNLTGRLTYVAQGLKRS